MVSPPIATVVPVPDIAPPVQVVAPSTVTVPAPVRVAPVIVRSPEIVEAAAIDSEPLDKLRVVPLDTVRLLTRSDVPEACVTVMSLMLICASSDAVGTCWSVGSAWLIQFEATSQSPPAGFDQIIVESKTRSSIGSHCGKKTLRRPTLIRRRVLLTLRDSGPSPRLPLGPLDDMLEVLDQGGAKQRHRRLERNPRPLRFLPCTTLKQASKRK